MKLSTLTSIYDDACKHKWFINDEQGRYEVKLIDDYGGIYSYDPKHSVLVVIFNECGYTHLIYADGEGSAWDAWLDEQETVPPEDVHEAYGTFDRMIEAGFDREHATKNAREYYEQNADQEWELIEGYEYQANATGTGIVEVGHYTSFRVVSADDVEVE